MSKLMFDIPEVEEPNQVTPVAAEPPQESSENYSLDFRNIDHRLDQSMPSYSIDIAQTPQRRQSGTRTPKSEEIKQEQIDLKDKSMKSMRDSDESCKVDEEIDVRIAIRVEEKS